MLTQTNVFLALWTCVIKLEDYEDPSICSSVLVSKITMISKWITNGTHCIHSDKHFLSRFTIISFFPGEKSNRGSLIEEINSTTFVQKNFASNKLDPATLMTVPLPKPRTTKTNEKPENLFHPNVSCIF